MVLRSSDSPGNFESSKKQTQAVEAFFNQFSQAYDSAILKAIPPYAEMMEAVLGYTFMAPEGNWSILELGCGTGNLSVGLWQMFPNARLTLVDLSEDMLNQAALKLQGAANAGPEVKLIQGGFMELDLDPGQFDLVVSSMALHHLEDADKPELYRRIFNWLKPGGLFRCADETLALPEQSHAKNLAQWEVWASSQGATREEIQVWIDHAEQHDHYAPLAQHFTWLQQASFTEVDCYWRKLMWTVFGGKKS